MLAHHYLQALELDAATGGTTEAFAGAAREALTDAGDRAFALHAYDAAARFFRAASSCCRQDDPRRPPAAPPRPRALLLGEPDVDRPGAGRADAARRAGDAEGAVEAETVLAEHAWMAGDRELAFERARSGAASSLDRWPPSPRQGARDLARLADLHARRRGRGGDPGRRGGARDGSRARASTRFARRR